MDTDTLLIQDGSDMYENDGHRVSECLIRSDKMQRWYANEVGQEYHLDMRRPWAREKAELRNIVIDGPTFAQKTKNVVK